MTSKYVAPTPLNLKKKKKKSFCQPSPPTNQANFLSVSILVAQWEEGTWWGDCRSSCQHRLVKNHQPFHLAACEITQGLRTVSRVSIAVKAYSAEDTAKRHSHVNANPLADQGRSPPPPTRKANKPWLGRGRESRSQG